MKHLKMTLQGTLFGLVLILKLTNLSGQVPVHEEPRHHILFQNKDIRILNVLIPPGDTSLYHIHTTPSLFIRLTETNTGSQLKGGNPSNGKSTSGSILFENLAPPHTRTHRVWNADKDTFNVMDIELFFKDTVFDEPPLTMSNLELKVDSNWVRAYGLTMSEGTEFTIKNKNQLMILVSLNVAEMQANQNGKTSIQTFERGGYIMIKKKQLFSMKNTSEETVAFALVELPPQ
jgi:hypothetical protein